MSSSRPLDLPDFGEPPVTEVVLSVQFERLPGFRMAHIGLLWEQFRHDFPKLEEHPLLEPVVESFESEMPAPIKGFRIRAFETPPLARAWFLNDAGTQLIQVQPDRFIHNWRKVHDQEVYPRYEAIRDAFTEELERFSKFVELEGLGSLQFNQCEVTYVNHINSGSIWTKHAELPKIVRFWNDLEDLFLPEPDDVSFNVRHIIRGLDGIPAGRLYISLQPGWRIDDKTPLYVLELTARGAPRAPGITGVTTFLDIGREWIVRGFAAITTPKMHSTWRRIDGY